MERSSFSFSFSFSFPFFLEPISSCPKSAHIPHPPAEHRSLTRSTRGVFARPPQPSRQKAPSGCGSKLKKGQKPVAGRGFLPKQRSPRAQNVANGKRRWQKTVSGYGWVRNRRRSTPSASLPIFSAKAPANGGGEQDSYRTASEKLRGGDLPVRRETYNRPMRQRAPAPTAPVAASTAAPVAAPAAASAPAQQPHQRPHQQQRRP